MKLYELIKLVENGTKVVIENNDGDVMGIHESPRTVNEKYEQLYVEGIGIEDGALVVTTEIPTFKVTGTYEVELTVTLPALCEDDAYEKLCYMDIDDIRKSYEVDLVDEERSEIEWDDAEIY